MGPLLDHVVREMFSAFGLHKVLQSYTALLGQSRLLSPSSAYCTIPALELPLFSPFELIQMSMMCQAWVCPLEVSPLGAAAATVLAVLCSLIALDQP